MFASSTLTEHVLRGLIGIAAFAGAVVYSPDAPLLSMLLLPVGLVALRGCPMCWTMGLFETIANKFRRSPIPADQLCVDGSCAVRREPAAKS
jgi:hypothetical protein